MGRQGASTDSPADGGSQAPPEKGGSRSEIRFRWLALWYVLASSYLVARLAANRVMLGRWGLGVELVAHLVVVSLLQLGLLWLVGRLLARCGRPAL